MRNEEVVLEDIAAMFLIFFFIRSITVFTPRRPSVHSTPINGLGHLSQKKWVIETLKLILLYFVAHSQTTRKSIDCKNRSYPA